MDIRKTLYESIYISGGTTMFPGFPTRIENDMNKLYRERILKNSDRESKVRIKVIVWILKKDSPNRNYNVFIGGAFFANTLKDMKECWITKQEWDESGKACLKKLGAATTL